MMRLLGGGGAEHPSFAPPFLKAGELIIGQTRRALVSQPNSRTHIACRPPGALTTAPSLTASLRSATFPAMQESGIIALAVTGEGVSEAELQAWR